MIVHVYSNYRGKKDLIGEILVKAQLISQEQLERVLKIQKETLKYLGEILVELQLLKKDDVQKVISTQIYETIYDLFWWEDGQFNFDLKLVESYKKIPFALSTESVLLNILRMVDEWSEIEKKIFSPYLVFKKTLEPKEKGDEGYVPQGYLKEKLTSEQELIYHLIDGKRTVQEIIDRSLLGKFNASDILVSLIGMGLLEVVGVQTPSFIKKVSKINFREPLAYAYYVAFVVVVFVALGYLKPNYLQHLWNSKVERANIEIPAQFANKMQIQRIKNALEVYYLEKGKYPGGLNELVTATLLKPDDIFYRKGLSYQYELKDGKYILKH
jgi:hypothetical protein